MKIGLFSDVHGNPEAMKNCFDFFESVRVDKIFFLGDAVGYLPLADECLSFLKKHEIECVKGNHDAMLLGELPLSEEKDEFYKIGIARKKISTELFDFIKNWREKIELVVDEKKILLVHGSPNNHLGGYVYPDSDLSEFENVPYDVVVMGQTHRPFVRHLNDKIFVNTGSVGLPRDKGNLSSFAVIDTEPFQIEIFRKEFEIEKFLASGEIHSKIKEVFSRETGEVVGKILDQS